MANDSATTGCSKYIISYQVHNPTAGQIKHTRAGAQNHHKSEGQLVSSIETCWMLDAGYCGVHMIAPLGILRASCTHLSHHHAITARFLRRGGRCFCSPVSGTNPPPPFLFKEWLVCPPKKRNCGPHQSYVKGLHIMSPTSLGSPDSDPNNEN